jgi:hypothetical protein
MVVKCCHSPKLVRSIWERLTRSQPKYICGIISAYCLPSVNPLQPHSDSSTYRICVHVEHHILFFDFVFLNDTFLRRACVFVCVSESKYVCVWLCECACVSVFVIDTKFLCVCARANVFICVYMCVVASAGVTAICWSVRKHTRAHTHKHNVHTQAHTHSNTHTGRRTSLTLLRYCWNRRAMPNMLYTFESLPITITITNTIIITITITITITIISPSLSQSLSHLLCVPLSLSTFTVECPKRAE